MKKIQLSNEVETVLRNSKIEGNSLFLPAGQLDRKLYIEVNKAIEASGGKWHRQSKSHVFSSDPNKLLFALETGTVEALAKEIVELADVEGQTCLEPSAGRGALVQECINQGADRVDILDIDPENVEYLKEKYHYVECVDFLNWKPNFLYDRIVANPPFTRNQDCKHVEHAYKFLKPGGKLVAIMANNQTRKPFKDLVKDKMHEVIELEEGSFKKAGTMVNALVLILWK